MKRKKTSDSDMDKALENHCTAFRRKATARMEEFDLFCNVYADGARTIAKSSDGEFKYLEGEAAGPSSKRSRSIKVAIRVSCKKDLVSRIRMSEALKALRLQVMPRRRVEANKTKKSKKEIEK